MMGRTLFVLRTYNDIDHISPVIWKFIQKGENPVIFFHSSFDYQQDYRIKFLQREGDVEILQEPDTRFERYISGIGSSRTMTGIEKIFAKLYQMTRNKRKLLGKLYRKYTFDSSKEMRWLREKNISAAVFEWNSPTGRGELLEKIFYSCKGLGIPTFSIPHGCNIYLNSDVHEGYREWIAKGRLPDFADRNEFDYYVVQSKYHLEHFVRFGLRRDKIQAWGSTRFYPEWQNLNLKLCDEFLAEMEHENKLKVVFMLPHWNYNVDKKVTLQLLDMLVKKPWIHLVIKDHTRGSVGLLPVVYQEKFASLANVEVNVDAHSPALIQWSDIVINFGSSIGIEVLLQEKTLIHPTYLHTNRTIFDETEAAILVNNSDEVEEYLENHKRGKKVQVSKDAIFESIIFGGHEPYDVLSYYYDHITKRQSIT